jgi:catechol 2,3-dioxygenase-like lactoylglutathione lyase family enzyme
MFAHLTIATRDVERTSRFFQQALGWPAIRMPGKVDMSADWLQMAPGQQLHILFVADFSPSPFEQEFGRHFAIFFSGSDFPALKERLTALEAEIIPPIRETPFARFFFRDPNGYMFEVIDREGYVVE